jgi:hypothetical protein
MFTTDPITGLSYFRPGSLQPLYMFELFGLLVALAAYNGITIPVRFPLALYNTSSASRVQIFETYKTVGQISRAHCKASKTVRTMVWTMFSRLKRMACV